MEVLQAQEDRCPWSSVGEEDESLKVGLSSLYLSDTKNSTPRTRAHGVVKGFLATDTRGGRTDHGVRVSDLQSGPRPSLHSLCLGVLALHLDELEEYGEYALPLLPSEAKLCLLAAARRRGELTNTALKLLVDSSMPVLDIHSTSLQVSSNTILCAARVMAPILKSVDITGCIVSPRFLSSLAEAAPLLQILRFGGFVAKDPEAISEAVLRILPMLEKTDAIVDSWEEALDEEELASDGGGGGGLRSSGRLMHLRCLTWPEMPYETKAICQSASPAVCINPSGEQVLARKLPSVFNPEVELDGEYLKKVAGHENWMKLGQEIVKSNTSNCVIHIADRF
ncbi:hypothetical protein Ndes2437B_g05890 [Nannochloris sp. 'desiccata']